MLTDILTYLEGSTVGAVLGLIKMNMEHSQQLKMTFTKEYVDYIKEVDEKKNYQYAKIAIALMLVCYFVILPPISTALGWPQFFSFEESNGFFTSLFNGDSDIHWHEFDHGSVYPPIMTFCLGQVVTSLFLDSKAGC